MKTRITTNKDKTYTMSFNVTSTEANLLLSLLDTDTVKVYGPELGLDTRDVCSIANKRGIYPFLRTEWTEAFKANQNKH